MTAPDARTPAGVDDPRADHVSTAAENVVASRLPAAAEWSVAALLTAASIALHITAFRHMGALWRDEANTVAMGRMTLAQAWAHLPFDSILKSPTGTGLVGIRERVRALGGQLVLHGERGVRVEVRVPLPGGS